MSSALIAVLPDLIRLGLRVAAEAAARRRQVPVASLTAEDLITEARALARQRVAVDDILAAESGGRWTAPLTGRLDEDDSA